MQQVESCTQPNCLLREADVDTLSLAQMIVRVLGGEKIEVESPIEPHERCVGCALRVLYGEKPLPTTEEFDRRLELGRWTYRRARRRGILESHGA